MHGLSMAFAIAWLWPDATPVRLCLSVAWLAIAIVLETLQIGEIERITNLTLGTFDINDLFASGMGVLAGTLLASRRCLS